jgi:hypothetical protein
MDNKGYAPIAIETFFNQLRGIRGLSMDMRRHKAELDEAIAIMDETGFKPGIAAMRAAPAGSKMDSTFDSDMIILAHTILNEKQWEQYYWPYLKEMVDVYAEKGWCMRLFTEGSSKRFWKYFREFPAGVVALHLETDDVFEARLALPNCCIMGGMNNDLLGRGTKKECLERAKRLIDELGAEGGYIMSQPQLGSYRNDANPENLKAVCDFVLEYAPSQH